MGYNLSRYCKDDVIKVYDQPNDVTDRGRLREAMDGADYVVHLAANTQTYGKDPKAFEINVKGTKTVLDIARELGVKVIYLSTCELYRKDEPIVSEYSPLASEYLPYAYSKLLAENDCRLSYEKYGTEVMILRLFNPYGYRQSQAKLIPNLLRMAMFDQQLEVQDRVVDYIFAEDVASAIRRCMDTFVPGLIVNVSSGVGYAIPEIAGYIAKKYGGHVVYLQSEYTSLVGDNARLIGLTGWKPRTTLWDGIDKTFDWYTKYQPFEPVRGTHAG